MKKLNAYFPIWFLLTIPPMLFLTLSFNFVMSLIGLIVVFFIFDKKNIINNILKKTFKLWGLTILLDIITIIFLFIPEIFYNIEFINKNLIMPLETNPYVNVFSFVYILILIVLNVFISKAMIKRFLKKTNIEENKKKLATIILMFFTFPYLFLIPSSFIIKTEYNTLNDYRGTVMQNKSKVETILKYLNSTEYISSYVLETHVEPYTINIYLKELSFSHQKDFEQDSAILFNLIDNVNEINFFIGDSSYKYTINSINKIFKNVKKLNIEDINKRYSASNFSNYIYLGRIEKYDVFDTSETCELEEQLLFEINNIKYYMSCTSIENIILYGKNKKINMREALDEKVITPNDLINSTIDILSKGENDNENIS